MEPAKHPSTDFAPAAWSPSCWPPRLPPQLPPRLPPREARTTFCAKPAKKKFIGSLVLRCNGRGLRSGQEAGFTTTRAVRRCTAVPMPT